MAYNYYLVYFNETRKKDTGTNVYAESEEHAKAIGSVLLSRIAGEEIPVEAIFAEVDPSIQEDDITTT